MAAECQVVDTADDEWARASAEWDRECDALASHSSGSHDENHDENPVGDAEGVTIDTRHILQSSVSAANEMGLTCATADRLAELGVQGASAARLEQTIMSQVDAVANQQAEKLRRHRHERELAKAQGSRKRAEKQARAERKAVEQREETRIAELGKEIDGIKTQIRRLERAKTQLSGSGAREAANKIRRQIAARRSRLKEVEGDQKRLTMLSRVEASAPRGDAKAQRDRLIRTGKITPFQKSQSMDIQTKFDSRPMMQAAAPDALQRTLRTAARSCSQAARKYSRAEQASRSRAPGSIAGREASFQRNLLLQREQQSQDSVRKGRPKVTVPGGSGTKASVDHKDRRKRKAAMLPDSSATHGQLSSPENSKQRDGNADRQLAEKLHRELNRSKRPRRSATTPGHFKAPDVGRDGAWAANLSEDDDMSSADEKRDDKDDDTYYSSDDIGVGEDDDCSEGEPESIEGLDDQSQKPRRGPTRKSRRAQDESDYAAAAQDTWTALSAAQQKQLQQNTADDVVLDGGLKVPGNIHDNLLDYQRVGLQWLWELHSKRAGGLLADEMGLGKTVQVLSLLGSLAHSSLLRHPSLIVAPATLLQQWSRELATWVPNLSVAVYHSSDRNATASDLDGIVDSVLPRQSSEEGISSSPGVIITTYGQIRSKLEALLQYKWQYLILDEGDKIRNPDTAITLAVKQFDTPHRLIVSGSPIQNSLTELWSQFDFVMPGKLGTLPVFHEQFEVPITIGGYSNASSVQVETAYRCSVVLRDLIGPHLLRRMKKDVATSLPSKTEQILFCSLTEAQRGSYLDFLGTEEMRSTLSGRRKPFSAITELRKICNHPDLLQRLDLERPVDYGAPERSGKMLVAQQILGMWHSQGHRALVFSQTKMMLDIIEAEVQKTGWTYRRLDGDLSVKQRPLMVDEYNNDGSIFILLLTTRVGGLGLNLTGADRVLLFDPDWNPSTDVQARERSWRLGQTKPVTVYRLLTAGTIEEKMYHRQVFKMTLTNRVLEDPMQRRFFKAKWLQDLFTLDDRHAISSERRNKRRGASTGHRHGTQATETHALFEDAAISEVAVPDEHPGTDSNALSTSSGAAKKASDAKDLNGEGLQDVVRVEKDMSADQVSSTSGVGDDSECNHKEDNARILRQLFDGHSSGVRGAVSHDKIMGEKAVDTVIVRQKAEQIAQKALQNLQQASEIRSRYSLATPTWTGNEGTAGIEASLHPTRTGVASDCDRQIMLDGDAMASEIIRLLRQRGGSVSTKNIVAHFNRAGSRFKMNTPREKELFRSVLRQLANLDGSTWTLKEATAPGSVGPS